jgi:hypothetical protein
LASQLISVIHKESCTSQLCNNRSNLAASAYQIAQHKQSSQLQISQQIGDFLQMQDYGRTPSTKPNNCVQVIMENFNSLGVFTKGTKINCLNKLCHQFNTNILAGCETQADWCQASEEQQFRNVIGMGMETRSIVAHNVNEQMHRNQYGRCAMMAMGCFSAEVIKTGVDPYGLGHWCWLRVGSGDKKTRIVMAYQPSGSKLTYSTGTTIHEQHERYFKARRDLQPARTIFYEQLIAQLIIWKHSDLDIILLGDFKENIYTGKITKHLALSDLMLSEQCLQCTGMHVPPTFRDSTVPTDSIFVDPRISGYGQTISYPPHVHANTTRCSREQPCCPHNL